MFENTLVYSNPQIRVPRAPENLKIMNVDFNPSNLELTDAPRNRTMPTPSWKYLLHLKPMTLFLLVDLFFPPVSTYLKILLFNYLKFGFTLWTFLRVLNNVLCVFVFLHTTITQKALVNEVQTTFIFYLTYHNWQKICIHFEITFVVF